MVYNPSDIEKENCEKGKSCDYGICDECSVNEKSKTNVISFKEHVELKEYQDLKNELEECGVVFNEDVDEEDERLVLSDLEVIEIGDKLLDARNLINEVLETLGIGEIDASELFD